MRVVTCRHPDGPAHDCAYVEARNRLLPEAERLAWRAAQADPRCGSVAPERLAGAYFHDAMDWLADQAGLAASTRELDPGLEDFFCGRAFTVVPSGDLPELPDDDEEDAERCCEHRAADHEGYPHKESGGRCTLCSDCPGWVPQRPSWIARKAATH